MGDEGGDVGGGDVGDVGEGGDGGKFTSISSVSPSISIRHVSAGGGRALSCCFRRGEEGGHDREWIGIRRG